MLSWLRCFPGMRRELEDGANGKDDGLLEEEDDEEDATNNGQTEEATMSLVPNVGNSANGPREGEVQDPTAPGYDAMRFSQSISLLEASRSSDIDMLRELLSARCDVNQGQMEDGNDSPWASVVEQGNIDFVQLFLDAGVDVNQELNGVGTAVHIAALRNDVEVLELVLNARGDATSSCFGELSPLLTAVEANSVDAVDMLLQARADVREQAEGDGCQAVMVATVKNHRRTLQLLLRARASPNSTYEGVSPLTVAIQNNCTSAMALLHGIPAISEENSRGNLSARCNHKSIVEMLLDAKASVNEVGGDGVSPVRTAVINGNVDALAILLDARANVGCASGDNSSLLVEATTKCSAAIRLLVDARASVDEATDGSGATPLRIAVQNGNVRSIECLLGARADVNATAHHEVKSPLLVVAAGNLDALRLLLTARANPNGFREDGVPVVSAALGNRVDTLGLLLDARGDATQVFEDGTFQKFCESQTGECLALRLLLEAKVSGNQSTKSMRSPIQLAIESGNSDVVSVLLDAACSPQDALAEEPLNDVVPFQLVHLSIDKDKPDILRKLLQARGSADAQQDGVSALSLAVTRSSRGCVGALIEAGAAVNTVAGNGSSPVSIAASRSDADTLCLLLEARGDPNQARASSQPSRCDVFSS
eukprot:TRINITY_DN61106_c0_g1_i1.p1 TRINITY_DN61106_c0_g1~~TRINITY_DN61106_c0_g1_i1.p1  ORF type:complete len:654 (+),score=129.47 TRINITY_DN61106_c0_g1_i1:124-2085(+)